MLVHFLEGPLFAPMVWYGMVWYGMVWYGTAHPLVVTVTLPPVVMSKEKSGGERGTRPMPINKEGPEAVRAAEFALPPAVHPAWPWDGTSPRRQPRALPAPSPGTDAGSGRMGTCSILTMQVFLGRNHWDGIIPLPGWKHNPGRALFLPCIPSQGLWQLRSRSLL